MTGEDGREITDKCWGECCSHCFPQGCAGDEEEGCGGDFEELRESMEEEELEDLIELRRKYAPHLLPQELLSLN